MCTDLQMCRVLPYERQMPVRIAVKRLSTYSIDDILDRRPGIKDAITLCWKWANNAVISSTVGVVVLRLDKLRFIVAGFASQYHFCHRIPSQFVWMVTLRMEIQVVAGVLSIHAT
jgi:hypothetical protein